MSFDTQSCVHKDVTQLCSKWTMNARRNLSLIGRGGEGFHIVIEVGLKWLSVKRAGRLEESLLNYCVSYCRSYDKK